MAKKKDGEWTIEKSMASLAACNGVHRTEDDMFSADLLRPTVTGGTVDLASAIKGYHSARVDSEGDIK